MTTLDHNSGGAGQRVRASHLDGLDIVRIYAAFAVMFFHLGFFMWPRNTTGREMAGASPEMLQWWPYSWFGFVGVPIFFVLSAALISAVSQEATAGRFLRARVLRLVPTIWICAALNLIVLLAWPLANVEQPLMRFLREATLFPYGPWLSRPFWTIGVEVSFYLATFVLLAFRLQRWAAIVFGSVGVCSTLYWVLYFATSCPSSGAVCVLAEMYPRTVQIALIEHGCFFAIGIYIWHRLGEPVQKMSSLWAVVACLGCALQIFATAQAYKSSYAEAGYPLPLSPWTPVAVWLIATVAIAASIRFRHLMGAALTRWRTPIHMLALATFPVYLLQIICGGAIAALFYRYGATREWATVGAMAGLVALGLFVVAFAEPVVRSTIDATLATVGQFWRATAREAAPKQ